MNGKRLQRYVPPMRGGGWPFRAGPEWRERDLVFRSHEDGTASVVLDTEPWNPPVKLLVSRVWMSLLPLHGGRDWWVQLSERHWAQYRIVEFFDSDDAYGLELIWSGDAQRYVEI